MCIGIPMQVIAIEPGHAWCEGRGERRRVNTALVGTPAEGDWLLIFLEGARECIDAERAREVNAALDLLAGALSGAWPEAHADLQAGQAWLTDPGFALPSAMSAEQVAALSGQQAPAAAAPAPSASASASASASPAHNPCSIGADHV
jgi:hydrogenase expression/formation protein HypC